MDKIDGSFLALLFRMKHINRWSLMHVTQSENLSTHTLECALTTHFLSVIGNRYFKREYDPDKLSAYALFHDATEILTGDLPTPIKYFNEDIKAAYKSIEASAAGVLLSHLPDGLRDIYREYFSMERLTDREKRLIKAADKLCAYLKCVTETRAGNPEFSAAADSIHEDMMAMDCDELRFFLVNCIDSFPLALDELQRLLPSRN